MPDIVEQIYAYHPENEQEEKDRELILRFLMQNSDAFERSNPVAHMTASAWVLNPAQNLVLMVYHKIYNSWSWVGGHADGDRDLLAVAIRECQEETGILNVRPLSKDILSIESLTVDGHEKRGNYVSSHLHLNVTYLLEADDKEALHIKEDENSGVARFTPDDALKASSEPWFVERIYKKLNRKCFNGPFWEKGTQHV